MQKKTFFQNDVSEQIKMETIRVIKTNSLERIVQHVFNADNTDCYIYFYADKIINVRTIAVHRKLLSVVCPALASLFEETAHVVIKDASYEAFDAFIKYFYQDAFNVTAENVVDILTLAIRYDVPDLIAHCESYIVDISLSAENVFKYFAIAVQLKRPDLKQACGFIFSTKFADILESESFLACDIEALKSFLGCGLMSVRSNAAKVFDRCIQWAERRCEENGKDATCMKNLRTELGNCFKSYWFQFMSFEAIAERYKTYKFMFTKAELNEVFTNLLNGTTELNHLLPKINCIGVRDNRPPASNTIAFKVNKRMLLDGITLSEIFPLKRDSLERISFSASITIRTEQRNLATKKANFDVDNLSVTFTQKIFIEPGVVYKVSVRRNPKNHTVSFYKFKEQQFGDVKFIPIQNENEEITEASWIGKEIRLLDIGQ